MSNRIHSWQWPNVLAVDAAFIAVGWWLLLARQMNLAPEPMAGIVLGLSVWLVYTADRWLDVRGADPHNLPTARHRFARTHFRILPWIWGGILALDLGVALTALSPETIRAGCLVVLLALAHTLAAQGRFRPRIPKEIRVSLIFAAGVGLFFVEHTGLWPPIAAPLLLLGGLCFLNCATLSIREAKIDTAMGRTSLARSHNYGRGANAVLALILMAAAGLLLPSGGTVSVSIFLCALGLLLLNGPGRRLHPECFRVLADGVLLLPWVVILFQ